MSKSLVTEQEWAAFVAIDWADQKHVWALAEAASERQEHGELRHTPEAVDVWAVDLYRRFGGRPKKRRCGYRLPPRSAAAPSPATATTVAGRRRNAAIAIAGGNQALVGRREDQTEQSADRLPEDVLSLVLSWFDAVKSPLVGEAVADVTGFAPLPSRDTAEVLPSAELPERGSDSGADRPGDSGRGSRKAQVLVTIIQTLGEQIAILERRIDEVVAIHPDARLFGSLPGVERVTLPRLIVAFGTRRERYESAQEVAEFSGIAPISISSGKTKVFRMRIACPQSLRQTFHELAYSRGGEVGLGEDPL